MKGKGTDGHVGGEHTGNWTFVSNHAHVLSCIDADPTVRLRDVAHAIGITERATQSILADLVANGYVTRTKVGRRNEYVVHRDTPMRHTRHRQLTVGGLLDFLAAAPVELVPMIGRRRQAPAAVNSA